MRSVVIPVYNEEKTLAQVVERLASLSDLHEIIIMNDGSVDGTQRIADSLAAAYPTVQAHHLPVNGGKTAAVRRGIAATTGGIVVIQDADTEYDCAEIPELIRPIQEDFADVVFGSRFLVRRAARVLYFYHYLANKVLTFCSNLFTNINFSDVETGYKAFRGDIIRKMKITSSGFGFEIEVTAKLAKLRCAMYEVPISYYGRTYEEGKKIGIADGIAAFWYILRFNLFCSLQDSYTTIPVLTRLNR